MKIIVALDKFKGSIGAVRACRVVAETIRKQLPNACVIERPLADGGDGTAEILITCCGGEWVGQTVVGPLVGMMVHAGVAKLANPSVSVVEMAAASGLTLLKHEERDPLRTTTFGTGQLLASAFTLNRPVWLAVGGSATVDGGVGAAQALGWKFLDAADKSVGLGGAELGRISKIIPPHPRDWPEVTVLCDVTNPLCGPRGAAHFFGPQKGATPAMVERLESGMLNLARVIERTFGCDVLSIPGGGAAGGLPAGAHVFLGAKLRSGIDLISEAVGLRSAMKNADWVVTGEGSFDEQSLGGKVVSGVLSEARFSGSKIAVLAGRIEMDDLVCRNAGIDAVYPLVGADVSVARAMEAADEILALRTRAFVHEKLSTC